MSDYTSGEILTAAELNTDFNARIVRTGDRMTGPLYLYAKPVQFDEAADKQYVDDQIHTILGTGPVISYNGRTGAVSSIPGDITLAGGLLKSGGTMTGELILAPANATPTNPNDATTKSYVDSMVAASGGIVYIGDTPPASPFVGMLWWDSVSTNMFVYYYDGTSTQWVNTTNTAIPPVGEAPTDGQMYGRRSSAWSPVALDATVQQNVGRNKLHNARFDVQQRGAGSWTANGSYTADRWILLLTNDTVSVSLIALADTDRAGIGDEAAVNAMQIVFAGSATAGSATYIVQRIESVRRLSGKPIVVSFWAKATSGTPAIAVQLTQNFGSGGSPSSNVSVALSPTPTLSPTWTRYSFAGTVPSSAGKTFGTSGGTDFTALQIILSNQVGAPGVQSGTVQIWGTQLEIGATATQLEKIEPQVDLANCQRFYTLFDTTYFGWNSWIAGGFCLTTFVYPATMRAAPTINFTQSALVNASGVTAVNVGRYNFQLEATSTAAGGATCTVANITASADL
jgi:hypothetical protein